MSLAGFILTVIAAALSAIGNLLMRYAMSNMENFQFNFRGLFSALSSLPLVIGVFLYVVAVPLWLKVLAVEPISNAQPVFAGVLFCLIMFGAFWFFSEPVGLQKIIGAAVIVAGILIVARA